jgi:hypothetical protein
MKSENESIDKEKRKDPVDYTAPVSQHRGLHHCGLLSNNIMDRYIANTHHKYFPPRLAAETDFVATNTYALCLVSSTYQFSLSR